MAPLLDVSITGVQASLHGRMEAFSTVLNFSLTTTTYNSKFDVWEPLVEPCVAIVRCDFIFALTNSLLIQLLLLLQTEHRKFLLSMYKPRLENGTC